MKLVKPILVCLTLFLVISQASAESRTVLIQIKLNPEKKTSITIHSDEKTEKQTDVTIEEAVKVIGKVEGWGSTVGVHIEAEHGVSRADRKKLLSAINENLWLNLEFFGPEVSKPIRDHFVPEPQFAPGASVTLPTETGDLVQKPVTITLPKITPHRSGSPEEARYLKGYAVGYADVIRGHFICRSNEGDRATAEWRKGWAEGNKIGEVQKKKSE